MTFAALAGGTFRYPLLCSHPSLTQGGLVAVTNETAIATTTDKIAAIGFCFIEGRAASKTISAAGGGSIKWRAQSATWANGSTTLDIGIQDVDSSIGPAARPNGTFNVKRTLTGGDGNIVTATTLTTAMTGGTGTKTINHGDMIAVVWDMTNRAGADTVSVSAFSTLGSCAIPHTQLYTSSAWRTTTGSSFIPNVLIIFDDGTRGCLMNGAFGTSNTVDTYADANNPDERGMVFQVPWDCKVDSLWFMGGSADANGDGTITLYSDPLGTPTSLGAISWFGERSAGANLDRLQQLMFSSEVQLTAATDYCVAFKGTGTNNIRLANYTLDNTADRATLPGGTTLKKVTRNNSTGAFTAESPAVTMYQIGVGISSVNTTATGSGSGRGMMGG
jgi:hypothetical protein